MSADRAAQSLRALGALAERCASLAPQIERLARRYSETLRRGGTLFFAGNGGSAADAQHIAAEYVVRHQQKRPGLAALALTTDTSLLTAAANDMGFGEVFARQVRAFDDALPFGGYKQSGWGREGGSEVLDAYTQTKTVVMKL